MVKNILIRYSPTKYYEKMANDLQEEIKNKVKDSKVSFEEVDDFTGAFEVAVEQGNDYKLIHSKLNTGKGVVKENMDDVIKMINK